MLRFSLQYAEENNVKTIDPIYEIHSNNMECLAGMSMFLLHSIHNAIRLKYYGDVSFDGSILFRGSNKSLSQLMNIRGFRMDIGNEIVGTGSGIILQMNLAAIYYWLESVLESNPKLFHLPIGHRAIAACAGKLFLVILSVVYLLHTCSAFLSVYYAFTMVETI